MSSSPAPPDTDPIVARKARAVFPPEQVMSALKLLAGYAGPDRVRVQLAMLKLCAGSLEQLELQLSVADVDHEDAIRFAERPREAVLWDTQLEAMAPAERNALRQEDRDEYLAWLEAEGKA